MRRFNIFILIIALTFAWLPFTSRDSRAATCTLTNFGKVTVSTGYASGATSIALSSGHGSKLPAVSGGCTFNLVWWNSTDYSDPSDDPGVEIVTVTARSGDTLTVTRGQEGTSPANHNTGGKTYKMLLGVTKALLDTFLTSATLNNPTITGVVAGGASYTGITATSPTITTPTITNGTVSGNFTLPATSSASVGVLASGPSSFLHRYGTENTFLGLGAGNFTLTTGTKNTAVGYESGLSLTTGQSNVALGRYAMRTNASATDNVALGENAMRNLASGLGANVAAGASALFTLTTGDLNTAIGWQSMFSGTTAYTNVAIGNETLYACTTCFMNTAIGSVALNSLTTANRNVAVGREALRLLTTANNNTGLGTDAGHYVTTGASNTLVGARSGVTQTEPGNSLTTGANNTFVGYESGMSSGSQVSTACALGYRAQVANDNACAIGGTGANKVKVGIGTAGPSRDIHVVSTASVVDVGIETSDTSGTAQYVLKNGDRQWELVLRGASNDVFSIANGTASTYPLTINTNDQIIMKNGCALIDGSGTPEGAITAPVCSLYYRTDGAAGTTLYVKESGSGNTGWSAMASGSQADQITSADHNETTTTLAQVDSLSKTVTAGATYQIRGVFSTTVTSGGQAWDLSGTATATYLLVQLLCVNSSTGAITLSGRFTALATELNETAAGAHSGFCTMNGSITVNAGGTLFPRFAQQGTASGTATVLRGALWSVK